MTYYYKIVILYFFSFVTVCSQTPHNSIFELVEGYPVNGGFDPLCLDYDGDGTKEFVYNSNDKIIDMVGYDLSHRDGWPTHIPSYANSVSAGDITGDGFNEIAFSIYEQLYVLDHSGNVLNGFPIINDQHFNTFMVLEDINNNGKMEIIATAGGNVYIFDLNGETLNGWPNYGAGLLAVGDLDNDGNSEIIGIGTSEIKVWHANGTIMKGWENVILPDWRNSGDVLIGDINNDGKLEITFKAGGLVSYSSDGNMLGGFPVYPDKWKTYDKGWGALGDLNNDGLLEIIMVADRYLYAFDCNGNKYTENYPITVQYENYRSPSIADITGDNIPEILYGDGDGFLYFISSYGHVLDGFPIKMGWARIGQLQVGDFNNDGFLDLLFYCGQIHAYSFDVHLNNRTIQWGVWGHDSRRTSNYSTPVKQYHIPGMFVLHQNYPNPFNSTTNIKYDLFKESYIKLAVYDILGREISVLVDEFKEEGIHFTSFNGNHISSGVYFCRLQVDNSYEVKKMLILR